MVKTLNRPTVRCQIAEKMGFSKTFPFFWDYILEKENTHFPWQLLDSTSFNRDYIPEQGKLLDTVQLLDSTIRVLLPD